ncbi:MAG TPA: hypothetical protein VFV28_10365, partial [Limnobacter sp.]|nr:hypothetical protein [Limnobacter sp.]
MNSSTPSIEQQARIAQVKGNVQLVRDGFYLPAQVGQLLLPGDRLVTADNARALVQFTGVKDALVIEQGAAATFNLEVLDAEQVPQWIATELQGEGVFFENAQLANSEVDAGNAAPVVGLFGTGSKATSGNEGTGYPVLEVTAGLLATAAVFNDYDSDDTSNSMTSANGNTAENGGTGSSNPPTGQNPDTPTNPEPEMPAEPAAGPLDAVLEPLASLLGGSLPGLSPAGSSPLDGLSGLSDL